MSECKKCWNEDICENDKICIGFTKKDHECKFRWMGDMPGTGMWACYICRKPEDKNTFNGKK